MVQGKLRVLEGDPLRRPVSISITVLLAVGIAFSVALYTVSEARAATYSQTVDNSTSGRFSASGRWVTSAWDSQRFGPNYRVLKRPAAAAGNARWKVRIPARDLYTVYARWPADVGYTGRATFRISTASGTKSKVVSQKTNGGKFVKLGTYRMAAGDGWKIALASQSSSKGFIVADAVRVVKSGTAPAPVANSGGTTSTVGAQVVAEAKKHIGKPYVYGAAGPNSFDCSGLTMYVYSKFGKSLPHSAASQYNYGRAVSGSGLKAGDLIFGNAGGSGIQHVGIYDGNGRMIHAGNEQTDVESTPFPNSWYNVVGYRRLVG